jgi:signal transduction histidine kinase
MDEETRVVLFRSVRELLVNVVKHAKVATARVQLDTTIDGRARIVVSDTGAGFNPEALRAWDGTSGGFGLFSVRERLEALGGRLDIDSAPSRGARFTIVGPPPEQAQSRTREVSGPAPAPKSRRRTGGRAGAAPGKTRKPGRSG